MAGTGIVVEGQRELIRAFNKFDKDLVQDLVFELEEAADPARKLSTELILGELQNMPPTPQYAAMRIGVAKSSGTVYVAPEWHRGSGAGSARPSLAASMYKRMVRAVEQSSGEVERKLGHWLDTLADDWGEGI